jgi:hypothetical protein
MYMNYLQSVQRPINKRSTDHAGGFSRFVKWTEQYRELSCILPCPEIYVGLYLQNLMESAQHFSAKDNHCRR